MGAAKGIHVRGLDPALPFHNVDPGKLLHALCLSFCICKVGILPVPNPQGGDKEAWQVEGGGSERSAWVAGFRMHSGGGAGEPG